MSKIKIEMKIKKMFFVALLFGIQVQPLFAAPTTPKSSGELLEKIGKYISKNDVLKKDALECFKKLDLIRKDTETKCREMKQCNNNAQSRKKLESLLVIHFQKFLKILKKQVASLQKNVSKSSVPPARISQTLPQGFTTKHTSQISSQSRKQDPSTPPTSSFKCPKEIAHVQEALNTSTTQPAQKFEKEHNENERVLASAVMQKLSGDSQKSQFDQADYKKLDAILNKMTSDSSYQVSNCEQAYNKLTEKVIENIS